jgi:hypothetical protein
MINCIMTSGGKNKVISIAWKVTEVISVAQKIASSMRSTPPCMGLCHSFSCCFISQNATFCTRPVCGASTVGSAVRCFMPSVG